MENPPGLYELDELYWFVGKKPHTETRENAYIFTMVSREPRQLIGFDVSMEKSAKYIQSIVDNAPDAKYYCSDGYVGYLDVVYPGVHIRNLRDKSDMIISRPEPHQSATRKTPIRIKERIDTKRGTHRSA